VAGQATGDASAQPTPTSLPTHRPFSHEKPPQPSCAGQYVVEEHPGSGVHVEGLPLLLLVPELLPGPLPLSPPLLLLPLPPPLPLDVTASPPASPVPSPLDLPPQAASANAALATTPRIPMARREVRFMTAARKRRACHVNGSEIEGSPPDGACQGGPTLTDVPGLATRPSHAPGGSLR
jgi:hypothetical protein